eukprot:1639321-Rhodomonas_salina.1
MIDQRTHDAIDQKHVIRQIQSILPAHNEQRSRSREAGRQLQLPACRDPRPECIPGRPGSRQQTAQAQHALRPEALTVPHRAQHRNRPGMELRTDLGRHRQQRPDREHLSPGAEGNQLP